jgi:hypothetical protein
VKARSRRICDDQEEQSSELPKEEKEAGKAFYP